MKKNSPENLRLELRRDGRVLVVHLNRPEVRNAFNEILIKELHETFNGPAAGKSAGYEKVRLVILRGEGKAFCGGGDLNWMKSSLALSEAENFKDCRVLTEMFLAMDRCPNPVVGYVHGFAIGGGVGLTSVCDHIIAEENTIFSLSEVKLGLIPACIGPFVLSKIGLSQCRSLFISGDRFSAERAREIGLVHEVVQAENADARLEALEKQILEGGQHAISVAKELLQTLFWDLRNQEFSDSLDYAAKSLARLRVGPEGQEGLKAFLEKRTPAWRPKL